jgi:hypothetical protein
MVLPKVSRINPPPVQVCHDPAHYPANVDLPAPPSSLHQGVQGLQGRVQAQRQDRLEVGADESLQKNETASSLIPQKNLALSARE